MDVCGTNVAQDFERGRQRCRSGACVRRSCSGCRSAMSWRDWRKVNGGMRRTSVRVGTGVGRSRGQNGYMARKIATNTAVDLQELLEFVRPRHHMVLLT